jgi:hypothetical protein
MPTTYTLIASTDIGAGGVSTFTFSSIPQTYKDLQLFSSARVTVSGRTDGQFIFNSVTSGYSYTFAEGYSTNTVYVSNSNATSQVDVLMNQSDNTANYFGTSQYYISNYTSTNQKPHISRQCDPSNSSSTFYIQTGAGQMAGTQAVTSLTISAKGGNIAQYSKFHLYGISYT